MARRQTVEEDEMPHGSSFLRFVRERRRSGVCRKLLGNGNGESNNDNQNDDVPKEEWPEVNCEAFYKVSDRIVRGRDFPEGILPANATEAVEPQEG